MGKTLELTPEQQLVQKFRALFDLTMNKLDNTGFTFEDFIESFDETDVFICRLFEFVVKDAGQKHKKKTLPPGDNPTEELSDPLSLRDVLINFRRRHSIFPPDYGISQPRPTTLEPSPMPFSSYTPTVSLPPFVYPDFSNDFPALSDTVSQPQVNPSSPGLFSTGSASLFPLPTNDSIGSRSNSISDSSSVQPHYTQERTQLLQQINSRTSDANESYASATLASLRFPASRRSSVPHFVRQHHMDAVRRLSILRNHPYSGISSPNRTRAFYPPMHNAFLPDYSRESRRNTVTIGSFRPADSPAEFSGEQSAESLFFPFDPHQ